MVWCPDGWHRGESRARLSYTGSLSVEDFNRDKFFLTGFTVQVFHELQDRSGHAPSAFALASANEILRSPDNAVLHHTPMFSEPARGFDLTDIRYRNAPRWGRRITVHKTFVAMDALDRLVILTFESPDESWERHFGAAGKLMLENLMFVLPGAAGVR